MRRARSRDDALLDRLRAGTGDDVEADPRLPLVRALAQAASQPPPPAVERRHLAAISRAVRDLGADDLRPELNGRPKVRPGLAHRTPRLRLGRPVKLAALMVATVLALTGVVFASGGLPAPVRAALEELGLLPEDKRGARVTARPAVGTASRRGPVSRCPVPGERAPSARPAWCGPPSGRGTGKPAPSRGLARRSDRDGRARPGESGTRRGQRTEGRAATAADLPPPRRAARGATPGRSGSSPSRRGYAPVGGGHGRSRGGGAAGSERGRSSSAPRGPGRSRGRGPAMRERAGPGVRDRAGRAADASSSR